MHVPVYVTNSPLVAGDMSLIIINAIDDNSINRVIIVPVKDTGEERG